MSDRDLDPRGKRRPWLRVALGLAVTAALLALLARYVDLEDVRDVLVGADLSWVALGLVLYVALQAVRAVRFKLLAPEASMRLLLGVHAVHALLLRVMPMRTGELGFAWLMRRSGAVGFTQSLVSVLLLRILDLASVLAVFAAALALFSGTFREDAAPNTALAIGVGVVAALAPLYLRHLLVLAHRVFDGALAATRLARVSSVERGQRSLRTAVASTGTIPQRVLWQVTGLTVVQWAINFALFWVLLEAMGIEVSVAQSILGGTGSVLGGLLPLAGVGNFGPLEAGWSLGFAAVGVETESAVASAFGFSVISFAYSVVVGAVGWISLPRPPERDA
ncbi:MAG: flippase-like domain-containing protein [Sandaracinaceae bacterium]|nr:flippase-like domain-containing protein [Sandaracinaceae bacterium]